MPLSRYSLKRRLTVVDEGCENPLRTGLFPALMKILCGMFIMRRIIMVVLIIERIGRVIDGLELINRARWLLSVR